MDELDRDRAGDARAAVAAPCQTWRHRPRQGEGGADPLAAGADEVRRDLGQEGIGRSHRSVQLGLDPDEIVGAAGQIDGRSAARGRRFSRPRHAPTVRSSGNNLQAGRC